MAFYHCSFISLKKLFALNKLVFFFSSHGLTHHPFVRRKIPLVSSMFHHRQALAFHLQDLEVEW